MLAGVCGGLGRYFDVDPVVFRVVFGVLAVTGGAGLIFYGFAWLLVPLEGEEDNEAKRLLTGRIEGSTLAAVLAALVGCALFLSMLDNGAVTIFSVLVILAVGAAARGARRRRETPEPEAEAAHPRAEAPPETQAPPTPMVMSWWRDPLVKDGTTGPVGMGYLWGPEDAHGATRSPASADSGKQPPDVVGESPDDGSGAVPAAGRRGQGIGGRTFLLALLAAGIGTAATWEGNPLGEALQTGFAAALAVFGLGLAISSVKGRTGFGTLLLSVLTAGLLLGAAVLPREIGTDWRETRWQPASVSALKPQYEAGTGLATLDLSRVDVPEGQTVSVEADMDAGRLKVILPAGVTAKTDIRVRLGDVRLPGEKPDHVRVQKDAAQTPVLAPPAGAKPGGTMELQLRVAVGQVEVARAAS